MLEKNFEKRAIQELRSWPNSWWPDKSHAGSVRGLPDRIGCVNGIIVALEFKKTKSEAAKKKGRAVLQRHILDEIERAGGYGAFVYPGNWELVKEEIKDFCGVL